MATLSLLATVSTAASDAEPRHRGPITDLLVHGDRVLSCSQAGVISETVTGKDRRWLLRPEFRVYSLAPISEQPGRIAIGGGLPAEAGIVAVLDVEAGELIAEQRISDDLVYSLAVDPESTSVAAACADGGIVTLRLDKLGSSELATRHRHTATARDVAFSADGSRLASCGHDGLILLSTWPDSTDAAPLALAGHTAAVHCLAFSPDGKQIASGARDGKVRLHHIDGPHRRTWSRLDGEVSCVTWSSVALFVGTSSGIVYRLSPINDQATSLNDKNSDPVFAIAASDGGKLAVARFALQVTDLPRQ